MPQLDLTSRPRRNRHSEAMRRLVRETTLTPDDFLMPVFVHEDAEDTPLQSMPGVTRWSVPGLVAEAGRVAELGIRGVVLFPKIEDSLKTADGVECANPDGLVPRAIAAIKDAHPELLVVTDVALDPYSSDGQDGIVGPDGRVANDVTVEMLVRQALCHAEAGADIIAPSDMMDGRVGAIRSALDGDGHTTTAIMAYTAKYASAFYGPFRGALDSAPKDGDKTGYQMDPGNSREALRELALDVSEGADVVMVKPAGPYLDVLARVAAASVLPVAAYQVSGEYLMLKAASAAGWLEEEAVVLESVTGIKRAGADIILSYFAADVAAWLA
ncbi:porphobilinogen synthase [Euzebya tangerina]|uniref:porphobilinogen synthase n=1 Tax=Euzebya tangerina TaxID=591198 RepID=UPI000E324BCD|nr:porphobilinogen synthase [Euzebya tangerina]